MVLNLRDENGRNIVDIEIFQVDNKDGKYIEVKSVIIIEPYSLKLIQLIKHDVENVKIFIETMSFLMNLVDGFWKIYCEKHGNTNIFANDKHAELFQGRIVAKIKMMLTEASNAFDLTINFD